MLNSFARIFSSALHFAQSETVVAGGAAKPNQFAVPFQISRLRL
jgi:hypothetical protein